MKSVASRASMPHGSEVPITGSEWETRQMTIQPDAQVLFLPVKKPDVIVPVIELTLK